MPTDAKASAATRSSSSSSYNLANIAPARPPRSRSRWWTCRRRTRRLRDAVAKTTGRVLNAQLNEQDRQNVTAQFDFEVRRTDSRRPGRSWSAGEVVAGRWPARRGRA